MMTTPSPGSLVGTPQVRRAAAASFFGSMLEFYDFFIYGTAAALIFAKIMFPADGGTGFLLSLATFGVAYVARPFGAILFGHIGDTLGRKKALVMALVLMGCSTVLIGCIPSYGQIGIFAPLLMVVLRILQGISAAGEAAGASSLTIEQAPEGRRGWFGSSLTTGVVCGFILASLVFLPITAMPKEDMLAWGWRIPFWFSAAVLTVAYIIRRRLEEPTVFAETRQLGRTARLPIVALLRERWRDILRIAGCSLFLAIQSIMTVFSLEYVTRTTSISKTTMLWIWITASAVSVILMPIAGLLSDRFGRKPVFISGCLGLAVSVFLFFGAVGTGNVLLVALVGVLTMGVCYSFANGVYPAFFPEMFPVRVRYSGFAIGNQVGLIIVGFAPAGAEVLLGLSSVEWLFPALLSAALALAAAASAATASETHRVPLRELGAPHHTRRVAQRTGEVI